MKRSQTAAIIGGGVGGLATANLLAKMGYRVTVFEARDQLGGRMGLLEAKGFRFDTGPSWYLMPEAYEHYFSLLGENIADHIRLQRLSPAYQVYFGDSDQPTIIESSPDQVEKIFEDFETGAGKKVQRYIASSEVTYNTAREYFLYNRFARPWSLLPLGALPKLPKMAPVAIGSLHDRTARHFNSPQLQQLLEYPAVFLGASPYDAPALFSLMSYLDFKQGVFYPEGGMYTVVEALVGLGKKLGVAYRTSTPVAKIRVEAGHVRGVLLEDSSSLDFDIVVSNADLHFSETRLLDPENQTYPEKYWQKRKPGPSALLIYLGIKGKLPTIDHHTLLFVDKWRDNFIDTFERKVWSKPASLYLCKPSATDSTVAPAGNETLFMLVPGPGALNGVEQEALADEYIAQLADRLAIPDLADRIVYRKVFGPNDFAGEYHAWESTALGPAHTLTQSALFRSSNRSKKVSGLYYVGAASQPGIGVPLCLISAELVVKHLVGDNSPGPLSSLPETT